MTQQPREAAICQACSPRAPRAKWGRELSPWSLSSPHPGVAGPLRAWGAGSMRVSADPTGEPGTWAKEAGPCAGHATNSGGVRSGLFFGHAGSSLLLAGLLWLQRTGLLSGCSVQASRSDGFSYCGADSWCTGLEVATQGLITCVLRA